MHINTHTYIHTNPYHEYVLTFIHYIKIPMLTLTYIHTYIHTYILSHTYLYLYN